MVNLEVLRLCVCVCVQSAKNKKKDWTLKQILL